MSGGDGRKLSNQDIQLVQNRVEQCLQHYMDKKEVINTLAVRDNIEPRVTELVWQRLEEENPEFFKAYYLKLLVKYQIMEFNRLLSEQVELMHRIEVNGAAPVLTSNGTRVLPTQEIIPSCTVQNARHLIAGDMRQEDVFHNRGSSIQSHVQGNYGFNHERKFNIQPNFLVSQSSDEVLTQTMNGKIIKTEAGYVGSSPFNFVQPSYFMESRNLVGDTSVSSFGSLDSNAQHLSDTILDGDASSFGHLAQISQTFGLPELEIDFNSNPDLLESFCSPPFLETESNNFVESHGNVNRLDSSAESLAYQCFGGN